MINQLIFFLEELKDSQSNKLLKDTVKYFSEEFSIDDVPFQDSRFRSALNGQKEIFYNELAYLYVEALNEFIFNYFDFWEEVIEIFDQDEQKYFLKTSLEISRGTKAEYYLIGIQNLKDGNPENALSYFNEIEDYQVSYFLGECYLDSGNYENAIKQYQLFLKNLEIVISEIKEFNLNDYGFIKVLKWNSYNYMGYAHNMLFEFNEAFLKFRKSLEIVDIATHFNTGSKYYVANNVTLFSSWFDNYLLAGERTGKLTACLTSLEELLRIDSRSEYYKKKRLEFVEKIEKNEDIGFIINKTFKPKKPYGLETYEVTKILSREKALEDLLVEQIKYGFKVFGKSLEIYEDDYIFGRQYRIFEINGILDLLLIDKKNDQLYVVELKRNEAGLEVVDQIEKYMRALSQRFGKQVLGIICLHKANQSLMELVKIKPDIELFSYNFDFRRLD